MLIVSDIDRAVPQAFPDNNLDAHGRKYRLPSFPLRFAPAPTVDPELLRPLEGGLLRLVNE